MDKSRGTAKNSAETDVELLEMNVLRVKEGLTNILKNFFQVGYTLSVIQDSKGFKSKQYKSFIVFTNSEFGLSKDQTYRMINIYKKFSQDNKYLNYSFGQLTEMLTIPVSKLNDVNETMTTNEIRIIKKKINTETENEVIEFGEQLQSIDLPSEEEIKEVEFKEETKKNYESKEEIKNNILRNKLNKTETALQRFKDMSRIDKARIVSLENDNAALCSKIIDLEKNYKKVLSENDILKSRIKEIEEKMTFAEKYGPKNKTTKIINEKIK